MATATVVNNTYTVETLYQWDKNQTLEVYGLSLLSIPELRFAHKGAERSIVRQATMDVAGVVRGSIPNSLLQQPGTIQVYIGLYEGKAFRTYYKIDILVKPQEKPEDYTLEYEDEVYSFDQLENSVVNALQTMTAKHTEAMSAASTAKSAYNDAKNTYAAATAELQSLSDHIEALYSANTVVTLTHIKNGTVHALTGLGERAGLVPVQFKATAAFGEGDTFTIDGVSYTAQMVNGESLADVFWASGATVGGIVDTDGAKLNFRGGGGDSSTLPALSNPATAAKILNGYEAINGEGVVMAGTAGADITNPADAAKMFNGYQAMLADGTVMTGSALATAITATADDVARGKTYYAETGTLGTGTGTKYYLQAASQACQSTSRDTTCTFIATGGTIDLAVVYVAYRGDPLMHIGLYYNGKIIKDNCGSNYFSKISSVSGNTVTAICSSSDVDSDGANLGYTTMRCYIISH